MTTENPGFRTHAYRSAQSFPLYPDVEITLTNENGNAFVIMGIIVDALREAEVDPQAIKDYTEESTSQDYEYLMQTAMRR